MTSDQRPVTAVPPGPNALRDHLANERTFLAWIRTAIAIIALGFVVARFGLILREMGGNHIHPDTVRFGAVVGVMLVVVGVFAVVLGGYKFLRVRRDIDRNVVDFRPELDIALGAVVAFASAVLAVYILITS